MVRRLAAADLARIPLRFISAAVLAPPVVAALLLGPPYSDVLVLAAGGIMAWEWARLCGDGRLGVAGVLAIAAVAGTIAVASLALYPAAAGLAAAGALAALVIALRDARAAALWLGFGVAYLAAACVSFLWLRHLPGEGLALIVWLVAAVWATDTGAYLIGSTVGGPRLAPRISPKKTWAGLLGGMASAGLVGLICGALLETLPAALALPHWSVLGLVSLLLALVEQGGDLLESGLKRHFGVKDASDIIPGHGGLLDRVDGLLAASLALGVVLGLLRAVA